MTEAKMSETVFNRELRDIIRHQDMRCLHIRETDNPGTLDLLVYNDGHLHCWLELKYGKRAKYEPGQAEFFREHPGRCKTAWLKEDGMIYLYHGMFVEGSAAYRTVEHVKRRHADWHSILTERDRSVILRR